MLSGYRTQLKECFLYSCLMIQEELALEIIQNSKQEHKGINLTNDMKCYSFAVYISPCLSG